MPLKREFASLDEIPEALRSAYVEKNGKFVLDLDDDAAPLKGALEKERQARAALDAQLKDIKAKLGDADPAKAREALRQLQELEEKGILGELPPAIAEKVDAMVAKRTERMANEHKKILENLTGENSGLKSKLSEVLIDNAIRAASATARVRAAAIEDAVMLGRTVFKLDKDGKAVPMKGEEVVYGKDGKTPMSPDEWLAERAADRPHWFEPSGGSGTNGANGARKVGSQLVITREQAHDTVTYRNAKAEALKTGAELVIQ